MRVTPTSRPYASLLVFLLVVASPGEAVAASLLPEQEPTGPKVLLIYDMEGVTGVTERGVTVGSNRYAIARKSLGDDVNAAINGLLRAGAEEVVLVDGHGSGNPEPDYPLERLPAGARHEIRDQPFDPYLAVVDDDYAAVVAIGMHVGSSDSGFMAHTMFPHTRWVANGFAMNESMIVAAFAAQSSTPLILVTGDDGLAREVELFSPQSRFVTVKTATSKRTAEARPRAEVSRDIETTAAEAFRERNAIPSWRALDAPVVDSEFGYRSGAQTELASLYPNTVVLNDKTVGLKTDGLLDGYLAYRALASYTLLDHMRWVVETIQAFDDSDAIFRRVAEEIPAGEKSFEPSGGKPELAILAKHGSK